MKRYCFLLLCLISSFEDNPIHLGTETLIHEFDPHEKAIRLLTTGKFEKALELYNRIIEKRANDYEARYRAGYLYLLSNKLLLSEYNLTESIKLKPEEKDSKRCLAEVYSRLNRFDEAADIFFDLGQKVKAKQYKSFGSEAPYNIQSDLQSTSIQFTTIDPLPRFKIKINGVEVIVQLDTGGSELILDSEFAKDLKLETFGYKEGIFGGGKKSLIGYSKVDSIKIGDFEIKNIPVHILKMGTTSFKGIIGTRILYQFLTTIDYPKRQLILCKKMPKAITNDKMRQVESVPFWLEGTHFMLAWGTANRSDSLLLCVDSGLGNGAFCFPISTANKINLKINKDQVGKLNGGGGMFDYYPAEIFEMTLGTAKQETLYGVVVEEDLLSNRFEYGIDGIISHNFLKSYKVTIDFDKMTFFLE